MSEALISEHALIHPSATIGEGVKIGPFTTIGADVTIGDGTEINSHVVVKGPTWIGKNNKIFQFSTVGEDTPDLKYKGEPTRLVIGDNNTIREGVTIHRGTVQDRNETTIGDDNLIMAYVHIGHDSVVGNNCIFVNNASLAGHVWVGDWAILSGYVLVHQFCHIGAHAFAGMAAGVAKDIPAYVMVTGAPASARSMNLEGLKRRGFSKEDMAILSRAFKIIYRRGLTLDEAIAELQSQAAEAPCLNILIDSLQNSTRGIVR